MRKVSRIALAVITALAIILALGSCAHKFDKFAEEPLTITFIETSDIHGAIFPYDFITGKELPTSMAHIATYIAQKRADGAELVLMDNGDSLQGQPTVYYYNFQKT